MSFAEWDEWGFGEEIIPVVPPSGWAKLAARRKKDDPGALTPGDGKTPASRVGFHPDGTVKFVARHYYGLWRWQALNVTPAMHRAWDANGPHNIGLRTHQFPALDIDIKSMDDLPLVKQILALAEQRLGPTYLRWRSNSPSCALLYERTGEPFGKGSRNFITPSGVESKVEMLATGTQIVVEGRHASGVPLRWCYQPDYRTPDRPMRQTLRFIDAQKANALLDAIYELVIAAGGRPSEKKHATGDCGNPRNAPPWAGMRLGDDPFAALLDKRGYILCQLDPEAHKVDLLCPWQDEHTDRPETGTAYLAGGGFACAHNACAGRHFKDVVEYLRKEDPEGIDTALAALAKARRKRKIDNMFKEPASEEA